MDKNSGIVEEKLLEKVVLSELDIPHALSEKQGILEESIRENVWGKWLSLKHWFLAEDGQSSESSRVLAITNDVIRNIIQNAALIVQTQSWGISRKDDYRKFLELFLNCGELEDAHRLSAHVFGIQHIAHFKENGERSTDSINGSVYEENALEYLLKPHTRAYRPKKDRQGFVDKSLEKLQQRMQYLKKAEQERELVTKYIKDGKLEISAIEDVVSEKVRVILLQWIAQANLNTGRRGRTEYGEEYVLKKGKGTCVLKCEDGELIMPAYVLEFTLRDKTFPDGGRDE